MSFGPVDPTLDLVALEARVLARWQAQDVIAEVRQLRKDGEPWVFYEGPPTANGRPGLHHVWARVFKDLYPRFQTMKGRNVPRKGGWDCHGLPVEIEVEKALGLRSKPEIEAFGIAAFNERCRESVSRYVEDWAALTERSGTWIDTDDAYWTLTNDYIETCWWLLRQMWDKGLLYEGHRVTPYCARCGTALSSHEVAQGYRDVVDPSVYVRFPLTTGPLAGQADLLVWTTTPWTLVSNVAAAAGAGIAYGRYRRAGDAHDLVMADAAAARLFPDEPLERVEGFTGADLVGWHYQRPFDVLEVHGDAARVVTGGFVTTDDGSGIVHLAPAFGEDDYQVGRVEDLPVLNPMGADGHFDASVAALGWLEGLWVKDADRPIIEDLAARGLLVREVPYEHSYPHCWRCDTPLIYWAKTSWFIRTAQERPALLAQNERIEWHPEHLKHGRFGKWLEGNIDWALSRDRYWGTPLPIWRCPTGHVSCVGSVAELSERAGRDLSELDLHRPSIDEIQLSCDHEGCDLPATRLTPVLDAWFDSGAMPAAQHHHPFEDPATFEAAYPADFICEAIDQTRGWFYSLLAVNTLVFDEAPYRDVVCLGHIVDETGAKMSKSRGNVIDPWHIFATHGADALRWYFFSSGQPWTPRRVSEDGLRESTRKTLLTLWNVHSFFATYADIDGWSSDDPDQVPAATHVLDRWILDQLDDTVRVVTEGLERFDALSASTRLGTFVDDLSNWYVRRSRSRFWKASDPLAHATLHRCLVVGAQLLAPFCPFVADELYVTLTGRSSVHASDWPTAPTPSTDGLAERMAGVRTLVALGRQARTASKVRTRQPLRRALLLHPGLTLDEELRAEIREELNVKALEDIETLSGLVSWTVVPNFRKLGPRLGQAVNEVKAALAQADGSALQRQLEEQGFVEVAGHRLAADEVEVRADEHRDFALAQDGAWAVALDVELDEPLRAEGLAREVVRVVNDLRKAEGLALTDRILLTLDGPAEVLAAVGAHERWVAGEVLARSVVLGTAGGPHRVTMDEHELAIDVQVTAPAG